MTGRDHQLQRIADNGLRPQDPRYRIVPRSARLIWSAAFILALVGVVSLALATSPGMLFWGALLGLEAIVIGAAIRRRRGAVALVSKIDDTVALINQGRLDQASDELDRLAATSRTLPFQHSVIVFNRGVAFLATGEPEQALALFNEVAAKGWFKLLDGLYASHLHRAYAVAWLSLGRLDLGVEAAARAHQTLTEAKRPGMLPLDASILCRQGRFQEALSLIEQNMENAAGLLTPEQRQQLELLQAFSLWSLHGDASRDRVNELVRGALPRRPRALLSMAMNWPEFAHFCDLHEVPWRY